MTQRSTDNDKPAGRGRYARRPGPRKRVEQVNIQMPPELVAEIDQAATDAGLDSRSEWVREACVEKLRRSGKRKGREQDGERSGGSR
jgi:metal-responsive CopG/Arc/MetJ family transcriptional regulator